MLPLRIRTFATCAPRWTSHVIGLDPKRQSYDVLLCATDDFALPSLRALLDARVDGPIRSLRVLVPKGAPEGWRRAKHKVDHPPIKELAERHAVPVSILPPEGLRAMTLPAPFDTLSPSNMLITVSFGHLIPPDVLRNFPRSQALNVHPSLLPRYRGAAPIQWAIANGDKETGVTVQTMGARFDSGDILSQWIWPISGPAKTYERLASELQGPAASLLIRTIKELPECFANAVPQSGTTNEPRAPKVTRDMTLIDWHVDTADQINARARAFGYLFPLHTYALFNEGSNDESRVEIQLHLGDVCGELSEEMKKSLEGIPAGSAIYDRSTKMFICRCIDSQYLPIERMQQSGRKLLPAVEWRSSRTLHESGKHMLKFVNFKRS